MDYTIEQTTKEAMPALSIRKTVTADHLPQEIGVAYATIGAYLKELGVSEIPKPYVAYYNMDMHNLEVEMGFALSVEYPGYGDINSEEIPAGTWVTFVHTGPYKEMGHGYTAATHWMNEQGITPTGVVYEFYLNDPAVVPESQLKTLVAFLT